MMNTKIIYNRGVHLTYSPLPNLPLKEPHFIGPLNEGPKKTQHLKSSLRVG